MGRLRRILRPAMLIALAAWPAPAAEQNKAERAEFRIAQRQLRNPDEFQRIEGIERLADARSRGRQAHRAGRADRLRPPPCDTPPTAPCGHGRTIRKSASFCWECSSGSRGRKGRALPARSRC